MSHYKPYPAYKDSGVEWLEKVPEHWEVTPLKYEAEFVNGAAFKPEQWAETGTPIIRIENLNGSLSFNCFEGEMDFRYHVEKGDLLFGWSGNRGTSFGPFIWPHEGQYYLNQHIFRICNFKFDKRWFYWSLKAVTAHVEDQAHGIIGMVHITKGDLGSIKIATPALAEQQAIAVHLDRETARIDALVEKKTRFIELLREKRQALITHAVTKGLDSNVKMKDSGVEWLGEVPEHWDVTRIKRIIQGISQGWSPECDPRVPEFNEWGVLKVGCVNGGEFQATESKCLPSNLEPRPELSLKAGDVLVSRANTRELVGNCAVIDKDYPKLMVCDKLYRLLVDSKKVLPEFLAKLISVHGRRAVEIEANGASSSMVNISQSVILDLAVAVPPVSQQEEILRGIRSSTSKIDGVIEKSERSIELLKERRSALITAAVTGQIDLREAA
ncbi:type I restriction-modification methylase S subunit [Pandoraea pnomenusa 3kgm]|uniref:restriction endonuclease subunit S n=1 Tax=Pandoraea pnomenusa TaxID=93220 RepID=UPI0003C7759A|nr:restriction endonuclease subunit S [Pandoraea pnomenusa]AHB04260.1 type I restriction-modification methylase S subunit [Pandoraea pnomenusa 3kgm]